MNEQSLKMNKEEEDEEDLEKTFLLDNSKNIQDDQPAETIPLNDDELNKSIKSIKHHKIDLGKQENNSNQKILEGNDVP